MVRTIDARSTGPGIGQKKLADRLRQVRAAYWPPVGDRTVTLGAGQRAVAVLYLCGSGVVGKSTLSRCLCGLRRRTGDGLGGRPDDRAVTRRFRPRRRQRGGPVAAARAGHKTLPDGLVDEFTSSAHQRVLEICAHVPVIREDLLRCVFGDQGSEVFAWLRDQPAVAACPRGLHPHDLVRDPLTADLRWRDPERWRVIPRQVRCSYLTEDVYRPADRDTVLATAGRADTDFQHAATAGVTARSGC